MLRVQMFKLLCSHCKEMCLFHRCPTAGMSILLNTTYLNRVNVGISSLLGIGGGVGEGQGIFCHAGISSCVLLVEL